MIFNNLGENGILDINQKAKFFFLFVFHTFYPKSLRENLNIVFKEGGRDDFSIKHTPLSSPPGVLTYSTQC